MIKRAYFLRFERFKVNGNLQPSWKVVQWKGFFAPDLVKLVKGVVAEMEEAFPNEQINLVEFKQI